MILIVGDDLVAANETAGRLASAGHAARARQSLDGERVDGPDFAAPDVLMLDIAPGRAVEALDACKSYRGDTPIPVILLIDEADHAAVRDTALFEPYSVVVKPFGTGELLANVELAFCRRGALAAVRETEDRFFDVSLDMLCFLGFNGYFRRLNPAWERALGFTREELMSRPFIEFVHPDDRERTLAQNRGVRSGGQALAFENRYLCKDGSYRWLHWNAVPDSSSRVIYSMARDVTERREAEEERDRLVERLQSALEEVKSLRSILPICSYCRKIRDEGEGWLTVESYISRHTDTQFSHGICPSCLEDVEPMFEE